MPKHLDRFLADDNTSPGVIIVDPSLDIGAAIEDLLLVWATTDQTEWVNRIGYIPL